MNVVQTNKRNNEDIHSSKGFKYKEAYCLMRYTCTNCDSKEFVWNSRDGVAPFSIRCGCCEKLMYHSDESLNVPYKDYIPTDNMRVLYGDSNERVKVITGKQYLSLQRTVKM